MMTSRGVPAVLHRVGDDALTVSVAPVAEVIDMVGVRYEFRVSGVMSDGARDALRDMEIQAIPPESIIYADVADEAGLRDLLALCGALGLELVSLQQLPADIRLSRP